MPGTQWLDVGNHPAPSHSFPSHVIPWQGATQGAGPHLLSGDKPSLTRQHFHIATSYILLLLIGGQELRKSNDD